DFRRSGTVEKPELAVCSSKNRLVKMLLAKVQTLNKKAVSDSWNKRLDKAWDVYRDFCKVMNLRALPSEVDTLVSFIVWLDLTQSISGCMDVLAAVSRAHLEAQLTDPSKEYRVKRVYRALLKDHRKAKDPNWPRDSLTVAALKFFVDKKPQLISNDFWICDAALIAIGLRTMRRLDQFANGKFIPIEYSNSKYCPVRLLRRHLAIRPRISDDMPLFLSKSRVQLSVGAVGAIVKRIAENTGLQGKFTAHSIRIEGAIAAIEAERKAFLSCQLNRNDISKETYESKNSKLTELETQVGLLFSKTTRLENNKILFQTEIKKLKEDLQRIAKSYEDDKTKLEKYYSVIRQTHSILQEMFNSNEIDILRLSVLCKEIKEICEGCEDVNGLNIPIYNSFEEALNASEQKIIELDKDGKYIEPKFLSLVRQHCFYNIQ
ncbi:32327_t:CDS:2, partial [Racocetra persica]